MIRVLLVKRSEDRLTPFQGLAMKLGITPCFMPIDFAVYLNKMALSAILSAEVYASAVSRTPGPVSVSWEVVNIEIHGIIKQLTVALDRDVETQALVEQVLEVLIVQLCPQKRVSVHYFNNVNILPQGAWNIRTSRCQRLQIGEVLLRRRLCSFCILK